MAALLSGLRRNCTMFNPPVVSGQENALKFGILGAANIAPLAFIIPARSHPEVIVHAVAAREKKRAVTFAQRHGIPVVKDSYEAILDDPEIDAVYIPLPNGLHYEWTLKALAKGKHVLLEKPSVNNVEEAEILFRHPLLFEGSNPPILMEAFHNRFTPAWKLFLSTLEPLSLSHVLATATAPSIVAKDDDIRFNYDLGGGSLKDIGTYAVAALREAFGTEPIECVEADLARMAPPQHQCDHTFHVTYKFPNGGIGEVDGSLRGSLLRFSLPTIIAEHKPVPAPEEEEPGVKVTRIRRVTFHNFMFSPIYHRIDVVDEFEATTPSSTVVKRYKKEERKKAYTFEEMGVRQPGEAYWLTYRYMLEEFVNRVRSRETHAFISPEDSIAQAKALDMAYEKSGLGIRPTGLNPLDRIV